MKRTLLIAIFLTIQPVLGATLVVNQTTPCTTGDAYYNSIQNAIDNASSGDRIVVCNGTYYEVLTIDKDNLTIEGYNKPIISASKNPNNNVVTIYGNYTTIQGFVIRDAYGDNFNVYGIYMDGIKSCNIKDVEIVNITAINDYNAVGIVAEDVEDITIENVKIRDIYAEADGWGDGIDAFGTDITIRNYEIKNLTGWSWAIWLEGSNIIVDNGVIEDLMSTYEDVAGIVILGSNGLVRNFRIHNLTAPTSVGVYGGNISNVEIRDGKIWNLQGESYGIYDGIMSNEKIPTISRSTGIVETDTIRIQLLGNNNLIDNVEIFNCLYGIVFGVSNTNKIRNCYIHDNGHGIYLYSSSYNTIERNIIENNTLADTGIYISSGSNDNEIHENCFINNYPQAYDDGSNNNWDRNYWDPPIDTIPGSANSRDNDPLPYCPCFPKVPMLNTLSLAILVISLVTVALLRLRRL